MRLAILQCSKTSFKKETFHFMLKKINYFAAIVRTGTASKKINNYLPWYFSDQVYPPSCTSSGCILHVQLYKVSSMSINPLRRSCIYEKYRQPDMVMVSPNRVIQIYIRQFNPYLLFDDTQKCFYFQPFIESWTNLWGTVTVSCSQGNTELHQSGEI